jgi:hypothetical protein
MRVDVESSVVCVLNLKREKAPREIHHAKFLQPVSPARGLKAPWTKGIDVYPRALWHVVRIAASWLPSRERRLARAAHPVSFAVEVGTTWEG